MDTPSAIKSMNNLEFNFRSTCKMNVIKIQLNLPHVDVLRSHLKQHTHCAV